MIKRQFEQAGPGSRKHERAEVEGYLGDIADGSQVLGGIVSNISLAGVKLSKLPNTFSADKQQYTAVISGENRHVKILIQPRWYEKKKGTDDMDVGFKIIYAPWEWMELVSTKVKEPTG